MTADSKQNDLNSVGVTFENKVFTFLHSNEGDHIFSLLRETGEFYELELLSALRPLLRAGDWVVDVGANIGNHAIYFAGVCGCNVIAFEPNPAAADLLRRNVEVNGLQGQVHVHNVALGSVESTGDVVLHGQNNLGMAAIRQTEGEAGAVKIDLLSNYVDEQVIRLMKIDTEGMDYDVLLGAEPVIAHSRCAVSIEASERNDYLRISALLERHGYMSAGSFNYTPTHLFAYDGGDEPQRALTRISRQASLDYIDHAALRDAFNRWRREALAKFSQLSTALSQHVDTLSGTLTRSQAEASEKIAVLERQIGVAGESVTRTVRGLFELQNEAAGRESARISAAIDVLHGKVAGMEAALLGIEEKLECNTKAILEKNTLLQNAILRLAETADARAADIEKALGRLDEKTSALHEAGAASIRSVAVETSACKDGIDAMFRFAMLWAEAENLRDAAQSQGRALLARDIDTLKRHVLDGEADRQPLAAPRENGRGLLSTPVDGRMVAGRNDAARSADSVWRVARKGESASRAVAMDTVITDAWPEALRRGSTLLIEEAFAEGWDGRGWAVGKAELASAGTVRVTGDGDAGFVTRKFAFDNGGVFEVEVELAGGGESRPVVSVLSDADEGIGHDVPLEAGLTTFCAFAPGRTRQLKLRIVARNARAGTAFTIRRLAVRRIDADAHQLAVRARVGEPVLASMASIPSRRPMLADTVNSLLTQCDKVRVFLNNYPDVPDFLRHPRVEVKRSQDWDDRGDAGKVFWLEHDKVAGYRLIVDDDLIFPPDFAEVMCAKVAAKQKKAIYATHGVLVRQPVDSYYDKRSRAATFHFGHELTADRRVHIGATNALCLHSDAISMRWADFRYCNSADIWLALHAQEKNLEVLTPARPRNWVRENRHEVPGETIYRHSLNKTRTRFDSSLVQDAVLKHKWPLTITTGKGAKYGLLLAVSDTEGLGGRIAQFIARSADRAEWVVMLAYDRRITALEEAVAGVSIDRETHLIDTTGSADALMQATELMAKTGMDAVLALDAAALMPAGGAGALVAGTPEPWRDVTLTKLKVGAGKHVAGLVLAERADAVAGLLRLAGAPMLASSAGATAFSGAAGKRKASQGKVAGKAAAPTINGVFERVKVLNLDRRGDRWQNVSASLARAGVTAERFSAVDGSQPEVAAEYERYLLQPQVTISADVPPITYQRDLYMGYASQMARTAYLERNGRKAIASRGAWGYLKSYEALLEEALADGTQSLLVFDDDVQMHKDTQALFAQAMKELPDDWLILQLGTLQYNWSPPWHDRHSPMLYRTNGSAVGSHAVGMRFDVIPFLLDHVKRLDMPYDIGALSAATRAFADRCFVISPNLAIQSMTDTDIGTSDFLQERKREDAAETYRWKLEDYS